MGGAWGEEEEEEVLLTVYNKGRERQREREIIRKTCEMIRVGGKEEERD